MSEKANALIFLNNFSIEWRRVSGNWDNKDNNKNYNFCDFLFT